MISNIVVYRQKYYYKGIEFSKSDITSLLTKISKNRRIILCSENILIKKYKCSTKSIDKFISNKIFEDFSNRDNLLFHFEIDKENKRVYLYSIRNNIRDLYETAKDLRVELLEFKIRTFVKSKLKNIKEMLVLYRFKEINYLLKIYNDLIVDIISTIDISEVKEYLSEEENENIVLVKDENYKELEDIYFNYAIDLGVDVYEKICKE